MLNHAKQCARNAGQILKTYFQRDFEVKNKGLFDLVTEADVASEASIIDYLTRAFPLHGILSEESIPEVCSAPDWLWIVDPLDGTLNYASRNPFFGVSIGLQHNGENVLGVVYDPVNDTLYSAEKGKGVLCNDKQVSVSNVTSLNKSVVCIDWCHARGAEKKGVRMLLSHLADESRVVVSYGSAVLAGAYVARGIFDAYINIPSKPWDHAATSVLVEEAGGVASTKEGKIQKGLTQSVILSNGKIHEQLLHIINKCFMAP